MRMAGLFLAVPVVGEFIYENQNTAVIHPDSVVANAYLGR
jgi:hypothetical protein